MATQEDPTDHHRADRRAVEKRRRSALEAAVGNRPNSGFPTNVVSKRRYSGVNVLLLRHGGDDTRVHTSKYWATFNQWQEMGGKDHATDRMTSSLENGAAGSSITVTDHEDRADPITGEERKRSTRCSRRYSVFSSRSGRGRPSGPLASEG